MARSNIPNRSDAAKLNPIISTVNPASTLTDCALLINQLGHFLSVQESDGANKTTYLFTAAISAAILFEVEASHV